LPVQEYPFKYERDAVLKDGSRIFLRPIRQDDTDKWLSFVSRLSSHTKYLRFHHVPKEMTEEDASRYCNVDYRDSFAIVAEYMRNGRRDIVAVGRYNRLQPRNSAEISFVVEDAFQNKGIATKLMEHLVDYARENGISTFEADVLAENEEMMKVFNDYGFHVDRELADGEYRVTFPIERTATADEKQLEREYQATVTSLRSVFFPESVAVIGASREEGSLGQLILQCIIENKYSGVVYPVNPLAKSVLTVKAYPSVLDIPDSVDLAIIVIPAPAVANVVEQCGRKGVRAVIIVSDGFREIGDMGIERERIIRDIALGYGMRIVGPNCMGIINTNPAIRLNGTFSRTYPRSGNIAFLSQSGAIGLAMLEYASRLDISLSQFISIGNRADISSNDLLEFWEKDETTRAILLYVESFGNPRKFGRIAQRVSSYKPIVAIKGGRTSAGTKAAATHTGAMAASTTAVNALFRQSGIIQVDTLEESFEVISLLSKQPIPAGNRVAILTNGGGPGIIAADACANHGLELPGFSSATAKRLTSVSSRDISINNPLDITTSADDEQFAESLRILANDAGNDAVIVISIPPVLVGPQQISKVIQKTAPSFRKKNKPFIACFVGQPETKRDPDIESVPVYTFPEEAVSALAHAVQYGAWLKQPSGRIPSFPNIQHKRASNFIEQAMTRSSERPFWLSTVEASELLGYYGIDMLRTEFADSATEAASKAAEIGFPVAVKLASGTIAHKTEVGGIVLGLQTKKDVKHAFNDIKGNLRSKNRVDEMEGVVVQGMISKGIEVIAGVSEDPTFGPLLMFGMGGIYTELIQDVSVRLHPLTDTQASDMIESLRMSPLLKGWRSAPPADIAALKDMLLRLSAMVEDAKEINEIDLNPVIALPEGEGYQVVDAKIRLK